MPKTKSSKANASQVKKSVLPSRVTEHSRERRFDGFLKVDEAVVSYERFDGGMNERQKFLVLERGDAAAALIHDTERDVVILTQQFRYPTHEKEKKAGAAQPGWLLEPVAGGISKTESPEDCIRREILEEVGYRADDVKLIHTFYVSPGGSSERIFLYYASVVARALVNPQTSGRLDEQEDIRRVELPVSSFLRAINRGAYEDAKLIIAAQWLRNERGRGRRRQRMISRQMMVPSAVKTPPTAGDKENRR